MRKILCSLALSLIVLHGLVGQGEVIFTNDVVHEVRVTFDEPNFWSILEMNYGMGLTDVPYIMANVEIDGETVDSIGVRLKGFSSYFTTKTDKKSIKLDFNEFVPGKRYDGLRKLNLNNGQGDPAIQRDAISYKLLRQVGVAAPRTAYAKVYLNNSYWGLYLIVEQIDKEFLKRNFGSKDGSLFKNVGNTLLDWNGNSFSDYQSTFELKTDEDQSAQESFVNFVDVINNSSDATFKEDIAAVFDVERYLKVLMIDVALKNWDSYIDNGRNFYLHKNANSDQFKWLPWDYNLAMAGNFSKPNLEECTSIINGTCPYSTDDETLQLVMFFDESCCDVWGTECQSTYDIFVPTDPEDCPTILNGTCPYPPTDTILQLVFRTQKPCCDEEWDNDCQELYDELSLGCSVFPIDMSSSPKPLILRLLSVPEYKEKYYSYWCEFLEYDFVSNKIFPDIDYRGNLIRADIISDPNNMWTLDEFEADLDQGTDLVTGLKKFIGERIPILKEELDTLYSCTFITADLSYHDLVINEFCASCDSLSTIADSNGEFDDWIEIYNNTNETIDLSSAYLSDNLDNPTKWRFPTDVSIGANEYLIVWIDNDENQQGLHTNFKLAKGGETIILTVDDTVMDSFTYDPQIKNQTASRIPNGTGNFVKTNPITFGYNNEDASIDPNEGTNYSLKIWPNPTIDIVNVRIIGLSITNVAGKKLSITITNSIGMKLKYQSVIQNQFAISMKDFAAGLYMINLVSSEGNIHYAQKVVKL